MVDQKIPTLQAIGIKIWRLSPWKALQTDIIRHCAIYEGITQVVLGKGNIQSPLMIIGEAPGEEEDKQGEPFVGKSGQLLNLILFNVLGLERKEIYITNIVKARPPNNRNPSPEEIAHCAPFLQREIEFMKPKIILTLGSFSTHFILSLKPPISQLRGKIMPYPLMPEIMVIPTFHPAYILRSPSKKGEVFQDMLLLKQWLADHT